MSLTLRTRLAVISACSVALTIALASGIAWWATHKSLRSGVDRTLVTGPLAIAPASLVEQIGPAFGPELLCAELSKANAALQPTLATVQLVPPQGDICAPQGADLVRQSARERQAASLGRAIGPRDAQTYSGQHVRVYSVPLTRGYSVMLIRDLTEVDATLRQLAIILAITTALGCGLAFGVGSLVARAGLQPVNRLATAAEHIGATLDLPVQLDITGHGEVTRLGRAFNTMLDALSVARERQQQLIADARHELRTPLTSLRTNVDLLIRSEKLRRPLPEEDRVALLLSVQSQLIELEQLVQELTLLAHDEPPAAQQEVQLADIVRKAVTRAQQRGHRNWELHLEPWWVYGDPALIERAVLNLADNAVKFSAVGSTIRLRLVDGELTVSDSGPGIPPAERELIFRRFWRSPAARALPGSGLGLAIVADLTQRMGGVVAAEEPEQPGAQIRLRLPGRSDLA